MRLSQPTHVSHSLPTSLTVYPRLSQPTHVCPGLPTFLTVYPRLSRPTHVSHGLPTSIKAFPRLSRPTNVSHGLPTSIKAFPRLSQPTHVSHSLPTSLMAFPRLSRPSHVYSGLPTSIPASPAYPEREKNINCLEIDGECHVTSRCYVRRFLSHDSFAVYDLSLCTPPPTMLKYNGLALEGLRLPTSDRAGNDQKLLGDCREESHDVTLLRTSFP